MVGWLAGIWKISNRRDDVGAGIGDHCAACEA